MLFWLGRSERRRQRHAYSNGDTYRNTNSFSYAHPYHNTPDSNRHANRNANSDTYPNADAHADTNSHPYSQAGDAGKHFDPATSRDR